MSQYWPIKYCPCCNKSLKQLKTNEFVCDYCNNGFKIKEYTEKEWREYIKNKPSE